MEMIKIKNMNNSFMLISRLDMQKNTSVNLRVGQYKSKNKEGIEKQREKVRPGALVQHQMVFHTWNWCPR